MNDKLKNIEIPEGWEEKFGYELFQVQGGYAFKSDDYKDEGILLVRIGNVGNGKFQYKDVVFVPKRYLKSHKNFLLNKGDVLMGLTGDLGKICILIDGNFPFILNQRVAKFNCNNISNKYLNYLLSSQKIQNNFDALFAGGAQKNISPANIEGLKYIIPTSLTEQKKIAQILSTVDKAIEQTEQLIAKYERIKTGLMQDLLTKGIDENGNIRSEETHEFKDSELGRIPVEWECGSILNYCTREDNVKPGPFGSSVKKEFYSDNGFKIYGQEQVISGDIHYGNYFIDKKRYKALRNFAVKEGDILLSCVGTIGNVLIIPKDFKKGIINPRLMKITLDIAKSDKLFFSYLLKSDFINRQLLSQATGGTMPVLNKSIILNLFFVYPIKMEQKRISKRIQSAEKNINKTISQLQKLQRIKTALMQDLLSGKKRVSNLIMNGE